VAQKRNVRVGQIFVSFKGEGDQNSSVILLAVEHDPPVIPGEVSVDVDLIEVVSVDSTALVQGEHIALTDFAVGVYSSDGLLHFFVSIALPASVVILESSDPLSLSVYEIASGEQLDIAIARMVMLSIGAIVKLKVQNITTLVYIALLFDKSDIFNRRRTHMNHLLLVNQLLNMVLIQRIIFL
jgi:hypothetical protein